LIGQLHIDGDVLLSGTIEGEIHATGDVEIDDEAKVNASVAGSDVNIRGHVSGPVTARKRLVVARSGSLTGDVRVARLVIQDGATFSGNVSMGPQSEAAPGPPQAEAVEPQKAEAAAEPQAPTPEPRSKPPQAEVVRQTQTPSSSDGKQKPGAGKGKPRR
jgi:cytoskeletal protein CcmA (bactofilin family)